jgi:PKD domain
MKSSLEGDNWLARAGSPILFRITLLSIVMFTAASPLLTASGSRAQMGPEAGSELNGTAPMASPSPSSSDMPAPVQNMHIPQPVHGSMIVTPPYGNAPLRVGFFVLATDPEGLGFLTYSWNFGDGTVSSLPPELYIFHTYQQPGTYVCELTTTTVDGRKNSFFQGVIVEPPIH